MRKIFFIVALGFFLFLPKLPAQPLAKIGEIKVLIWGLQSDKGIVKIGLYNTKEGYRSRGSIASFLSASVKPKERKAEFIFEQVPYGEYTIKLFHDANYNGVVDKNIFGIPNESYGFSNNPKMLLGPPSYDQAKFNIFSPQIILEIKVR